MYPDVPESRVTPCNERPVRADGDFVLYWMIAARRTRWSFPLQRAVGRARELGLPLIVLEPLRIGYRWASHRLHRFVIEGMRDNARDFEDAGIAYHPYVEPEAGAGSGLLEAYGERAALVVTDEFPAFFLPRMVVAAASRLPVLVERVDGNGLLPLRETERAWPTAYAFRRHLQKNLPRHLGGDACPLGRPLEDHGLPTAQLPAEIVSRWPRADLNRDLGALLSELPIDDRVRAGPIQGGPRAGSGQLEAFLAQRLRRYDQDRNSPNLRATSGLSPYLHFGHVSAHEVVAEILEGESFQPGQTGAPKGKRSGWWGLSEAAEGFLDELITWRELGHAFCFHRPDDYWTWEALPEWAQETLTEHEPDPRPYVYDLDALTAAQTHDELWNAAQRQLVREGRIHNYLRMLWGKKILHWSPSPRDALEWMIELNNRFALDGRDPNSYCGILWTLGRFDRPWGPERPIFGKVRYMTSANTRRKHKCDLYLARYAESPRTEEEPSSWPVQPPLL